MTTITCNGVYLYADKRISTIINKPPSRTSEKINKTISDDVGKKIVNLKDKKVTYTDTEGKSHKLVACAIFGDVGFSESLIKSCIGRDAVEVFHIQTAIISKLEENLSYGLVFITERQTTLIMKLNSKSLSSVYEYKKNIIMSEGSGSGVIDSLVYSGMISVSQLNNVDIKDVHLFNSSTDDASSTAYDFYSFDTGTVTQGVQPTPEEVRKSRKTVIKLIR